jgi:hypothetical protein
MGKGRAGTLRLPNYASRDNISVSNWRAAIPAYLCVVAILWCCVLVHRSRRGFGQPNVEYSVDVVVHAPEGTIIKTEPRQP